MQRASLLLVLPLALLLCLISPVDAYAFGEEDRVTIAILGLEGASPTSEARLQGIAQLLYTVEKRSTIDVQKPQQVALDESIFNYPFLYLIVEQPLSPLNPSQTTRLRAYLDAGGFLFIDVAEGFDGPRTQSARRLVDAIYQDDSRDSSSQGALQPVPPTDVVYMSFYLLKRPHGRKDVAPQLFAHYTNDDPAQRATVFLNLNDLSGALARHASGSWIYSVDYEGGDEARGRELAHRFGVNLVMYATCLSYKKDQVHIPFLMKRRNWKP